ncbi:GlsB/YeaQ/YmgE family stress response membrane protein [Membranihabitans marinus]|uniref:GlsB/YeaQ/YmgE family stress response membrane protein n=1 Tax=Membranihabitans marinus TaxID=1227546 RepID=UPI001F166FE0|nr:GlsB/YeaQ/YmgE family stress response membrane protein [Membranihabitans marinus]
MDLIIGLIVGGIAGWLASLLWKGKGSGLIVNIILGMLGAFVGGWIFEKLGVTIDSRWGPLITATVGAFVLLWLKSLLFHMRK